MLFVEKQVAWIDNIRTLTYSDHHIQSLINTDNKSPYLFWKAENKVLPIKQIKNINDTTVELEVAEEIPLGEDLFLHCGDTEIPVYPRGIVRTDWFDKRYAAIDQSLGAICSPNATIFSVWAPTATSVKVILNENSYLLNKLEKGVWKLELKGNWHGQSYEYEVTVNGSNKRVNDPYAKALLANSQKAVVVDFTRTEQFSINQKRPFIQQLQDAIIYELHVRDATIDQESGVQNRGKFLGLAETGTTTKNGFSTGLTYLKELGCTHVQLLPINDFARVDEFHPNDAYNWGYDPLFFQTPEGSYSVLPDRPIARINELKAMIQAFHNEGIAVILDVVFNHVFVMEESPFEQLVPGYYFRYHPDGTLSNGTGVGNDIASERRMVRKFILDTIDFMLSEYHVDGFRFDLMGAMDIETMQQIEKRCQKEEAPIMLLGEGWDLPTALDSSLKATSYNASQLSEIRFFNDYFRDSMKGNLFEQQDTGYINGAGRFLERMPHLLSGAALDPNNHASINVNQTINYVECHDNHTLWDRLCLTHPDLHDHDRKKMHQLATGITLLSQGVPFLHAGQEWFRSKQGDENSYLSGDSINMLDWKKREQEKENIAFVKALIALRKKYTVFRMTSQKEIQQRFHVLETPYPVFGFTLLGDTDDFSIYINPTKEEFDLHLPSSGKWKRAVSNSVSEKEDIIGEFTGIHAYEIIVFQKTRNRATNEVAVVLPGN